MLTMIRQETAEGWALIAHPEHARLAAAFATHWKNADFAPPDPFCHVLDAVGRHDDSWGSRDAEPCLTPEGLPSAFSKELVGSYDAFEEIDLAAYLEVRGAATEAAAQRDPYAAILISMHTVNLLTEQADVSSLTPSQQSLHAAFIGGQRARQRALRQALAGNARLSPFLTDEALQRCFEFLQACDSFSLYACADYPAPGPLRHAHPRQHTSEAATITLTPLGQRRYRLHPYVLDEPEVHLPLSYRVVSGHQFSSEAEFRAAYHAAPLQTTTVTILA